MTAAMRTPHYILPLITSTVAGVIPLVMLRGDFRVANSGTCHGIRRCILPGIWIVVDAEYALYRVRFPSVAFSVIQHSNKVEPLFVLLGDTGVRRPCYHSSPFASRVDQQSTGDRRILPFIDMFSWVRVHLHLHSIPSRYRRDPMLCKCK